MLEGSSWWSVTLVDNARVPEENHRPIAREAPNIPCIFRMRTSSTIKLAF